MVDSSQAVAARVSAGNTGIKLAASFRPRDSPPEIIAVGKSKDGQRYEFQFAPAHS